MENTLYYGDNLEILRQHIPDESIDLIYLDPPFKSNQSYNILFKEHNGTDSAAQIKVFEDTWHWDQKAEETYREITEKSPKKVADLVIALRKFLGSNDMMAYLVMMAIRLIELRRVLKDTGSIYLHCDPTSSHYLKMLLDSVFGPILFKNEIVWKRTPFKGSSKARAKQLPKCHDIIFFYSKGEKWKWDPPIEPYSNKYLKRFKWKDERGYYRKTLLKTYSQKTLDRLKRENRLIYPAKEGAKYSYKQYLKESKGYKQIDDVWTDINMINPVAKERLGYPTQKPEALLERIIKASSNKGDFVLDPFCGCGTTITVAEKLKRKWIGIDVTHLAIALMKHRLKDTFGDQLKYEVIGEPVDKRGAETLAKQDRYQFEWWALSLVGARPAEDEKKKGGDKGIDGYLYFHDEPKGGKTKKILIQVKSGNINPGYIRDLKGVIEREKAQIGIFITLKKPTRGMIKEAVQSGFYHSKYWNKNFPKIQILTIDDLLNGKEIDYPKSPIPFKKAKRHEPGEQKKLDMD